MRRLRAYFVRVVGMRCRSRADEDFATELESHIAMHTEDGVRSGLHPEEARRQALIQLGGAEQIREAHRIRRTLPWLEILAHDAGYSLRQLRYSPCFALTSVLTLALAIGANSAVFSLVHAILLRQLPFNAPSRVFSVAGFSAVGLGYDLKSHQSEATFAATTRSFKTINAATIYAASGVNAELGSGRGLRLQATEASAQFLKVLGITPHMGRGFAPQEDIPGKDHVVLISDCLWRTVFNANRGVLGSTIRVNGFDFSIIGVLPARMDFPSGTDLWAPTIFDEHTYLREGGAFMTSVLVRARANTPVNMIRAEFAARASSATQKSDAKGPKLVLTPIAAELTRSIRTSLLMLFLAVSFVLAIACANIATLMLVRTTERRREFALRTALGAARSRLMQQQIVEAILIALAGGFLGVLFAYGMLHLLYVFKPDALSKFPRPAIDALVFVFTAACATITGLAFGIAPAWLASRSDPATALKAGIDRFSAPGAKLRKALVAAEMGIAFALLVGAGLLLRTVANLDRVPLGFGTGGILTFSISLHGERYTSKTATAPALTDFYSRTIDRLAVIPEVKAVGASSAVPLGKRPDMLLPAGTTDPSHRPVPASMRIVSHGYFAAMSIPLIAGRDFRQEDNRNSLPVVIVSRNLAEKLWPDKNPIGRAFRCLWYCKEPRIVVGEVASTRRFGPRAAPLSEYYLPYTQQDWPYMTFVLRADTDPGALIPSVRRVVAAIDPSLPVYNIETMRQRLDDNESLTRFELFALSAFGGLSVLLVLIGLYGVIAYSVSQREREIGIRIALGARHGAVVGTVFRESAQIALSGAALGLGCFFILTHLLVSVLFGVTAEDPTTLAVVVLLFIAVAIVSAYLPARRAAAVDPMRILRAE
jgi:macrolide transport system ATP-binding/permease protein